jgi:tetratricopeptide (TPR) repeat protein
VGLANAADYAAAGRAAQRAGEIRMARDFFQRAVEDRRVAAYWVRLGRLERDLGRPQQALAAFENAVRINPEHRFAVIELASEWIARGEPARALEALERASPALAGDAEIDDLSERARALL